MTLLATFRPRDWAGAVGFSVLVALAIGVPTDVIPNPWFTRMTPVRTADVVLLPLTSISTGMLLAAWGASRAALRGAGAGAGVAGGLGYLAVGCPVCNKAVVALLGTSGALSTFAPLQLWLGVLSIALSLTGLWLLGRRLASGCAVPAAPAQGW